VALRFFAGLTQREIAARVGISQMHVSRLLRRSLEDMSAELGRPLGQEAA
jgi:RNA polymerase sigma-B factor